MGNNQAAEDRFASIAPGVLHEAVRIGRRSTGRNLDEMEASCSA